jgi:hypothetical protein
MHSQLSTSFIYPLIIDASPKLALEVTPQSTKPDMPIQSANPPFDPLSAPANVPGISGNSLDWDMQDLVWSTLPWDWNMMDDMFVEGITNDAGWGWTNIPQNDGQYNGDLQAQQSESLGMPVL